MAQEASGILDVKGEIMSIINSWENGVERVEKAGDNVITAFRAHEDTQVLHLDSSISRFLVFGVSLEL